MNVYIHIPFCHSKCAYCAFLSHCDISKEEVYVDALLHEIENSNFHDKIETIYFGGGTPSLINPSNIDKIIQKLKIKTKLTDDIEITLEANPEDITENNLSKWKSSGITRISIGVQTLNNKVRKVIGRALSGKDVLDRIILALNHCDNVGIDLIAGLPGESLESVETGIKEIASLDINHISLYDLETDKESVIGTHPEKFQLIDDASRAEILENSWKLLKSLGFEQYEISNFAKNSHYTRHNLDFWNGKDYIGFGLGAVSKIEDRIRTNTFSFLDYIDNPESNRTVENLTKNELNTLNLTIAMRLNRSFKPELERVSPESTPPKELITEGLVTKDLKLTDKGKLLYNQVVDKVVSSL